LLDRGLKLQKRILNLPEVKISKKGLKGHTQAAFGANKKKWLKQKVYFEMHGPRPYPIKSVL